MSSESPQEQVLKVAVLVGEIQLLTLEVWIQDSKSATETPIRVERSTE
jgi:hypothetical protein